MSLKSFAKRSFSPYSIPYNILGWIYGCLTFKPAVRRASKMRLFKDSRFEAGELWMAACNPQHVLDAVYEHWTPKSFLDVGCGVGVALQRLSARGVDCLGLEGSTEAINHSPVKNLIQKTNLNKPIDCGRRFDVVWSYEVAEHIHEQYADTYLDTLARHGDTIVVSAAHPGQGGCGHFNEQPQSYWIERMIRRGFLFDEVFSKSLQAMPDEHAENVMVFVRPKRG